MMMNRDKLGFWVKFVSIFLAAVFLLSFIFAGVGSSGLNYNIFDLISGNNNQQQGGQTISPQEEIKSAEKQVKENPKDAKAIKGLAALYMQQNRLDDAARVLEKGRKDAPKDAQIPLFLGQVYGQQAQSAPQDKQKDLYKKAGDTLAEATQKDPKNADAYYLAGQSYDQAGEPAQAIKYWNGYLKLEPKGQYAKAVKDRISALLKGGETTGATQ